MFKQRSPWVKEMA